MAIVDSGTSGIYQTPEASKKQVSWSDSDIQVGTASGQPHTSLASCKLDLPCLPKDPPTSGHVIPGFHHNIMGIGEFCDANCKVLFANTSVTVFEKKGGPVITGWRDNNSLKLCNISLLPNEYDSLVRNKEEQTPPGVYIASNLPSVAALVRYFHEAAGYPVRSTWLNAI